jgi:hypothetical protein
VDRKTYILSATEMNREFAVPCRLQLQERLCPHRRIRFVRGEEGVGKDKDVACRYLAAVFLDARDRSNLQMQSP